MGEEQRDVIQLYKMESWYNKNDHLKHLFPPPPKTNLLESKVMPNSYPPFFPSKEILYLLAVAFSFLFKQHFPLSISLSLDSSPIPAVTRSTPPPPPPPPTPSPRNRNSAMEAAKARSERESSPCYKKKAEDAGFLANAKEHFEQFKSTPVDRHWICLKNTMRKAGDYVRVKKQSASVGGDGGSGVKEAASAAAVQSQ